MFVLQSKLDALFKTYTGNDINLNPDKCKAMSFSRSPGILLNSYTINDVNLERLDTIRDRNVILGSKMNFNEQMHGIVIETVQTRTSKGMEGN